MDFDWDPPKARENLRKHRIDFADAVGVFDDPMALTRDDPHPDEPRRLTLGALGADHLNRVLVVSWTFAETQSASSQLAGQHRPSAASTRRTPEMRKQYDFTGARRGAVVSVPKGKTRITIRLDDEVLTWFRRQVHAAGGGSYQSLINEALLEFISTKREPVEAIVRRVVREELRHVASPKRSRKAKAA